MTDKLNITRRDFINGFALSLAAGTSLSPLEILARQAKDGIYPPALTGMRGSTNKAFAIAHAVALAGVRFDRPKQQSDTTYDMVVVGGGVSGLASAYFYQQRSGNGKRVLVLDNHDDFGGHARRNEFDVDGENLICYGGSQSIDTPSAWSRASAQLLRDLGIDVSRFYEYYDQEYFDHRGSRPGIYFSADRYGRDVTLPNVFGDFFSDADPTKLDESLTGYPVSAASKAAIERLLTEKRDYLADYSNDEKFKVLVTTSYCDFLRKYADMTDEVVGMLRDTIKGIWGIGFDALSALEGVYYEQPGTEYLDLKFPDDDDVSDHDEPYIFHFPDGNASIARALVRDLVPGCVNAESMEALVMARMDYAALDDPSQACRIRLNATAVDVRHTADEKYVDVTYLRNGEPECVRAKHVVLACYNSMIPYICPEVADEQAEAIGYGVKIPLVYISVAVRNWKAWAELGFHSMYVPESSYMHSFGLDFPVSIGDYRFTSDPATPTVLHGTFVPTEPDVGLTYKQQALVGRRRLYEMSYDEHEASILAQLEGALAPGGFDAEHDIAAITVNRWPHGYTYEYNAFFDPVEYSPANGPHIAGRAQIGRISIANSDASAYAYLNGAIDAADRAVDEQLEGQRIDARKAERAVGKEFGLTP